MACKIADPGEATRPVEWKRSAPERVPVPPAREQRESEAELASKIAELERIRELESARSRQEGFQEGLRQGREQSAAEVTSASMRLAQLLDEVAVFKQKLRKDAEVEVVKLSLAVARRILHRELNADPDSIRGIVNAALEKLRRREVYRVRVHPSVVQAVEASLEAHGSTAVSVVADRGLMPGGIVFETAVGELDASIDTQLDEIQRGFADRLALR
jgi:flagellar assembly protein FliH